MMTPTSRDPFITGLTAYAEQEKPDNEELVIPEDLTTLSDDDLASLRDDAAAAFNDRLGDGTGLSDEEVQSLTELTDAIEAITSEQTQRQEADAERQEAAAGLAERVNGTQESEADEDGETAETEEQNEAQDEAPASTQDEVGAESHEVPVAAASETDENTDSGQEAMTASSEAASTTTTPAKRKETRVPMPRRRTPSIPDAQSSGPNLLTAGPENRNYTAGQNVSMSDAAKMVDDRIGRFNFSQYDAAARAGKHIKQQHSIINVERPYGEGMRIDDGATAQEIESTLQRASNEKSLDGGSLTASGIGWCAPSQPLYDLLEVESRDGLYDLPQVAIPRGGIRRTLGPDFRDIFADPDGDFSYSEQEVIDGDFDGAGGGTKPCVKVDCPPFEEFRLRVAGLCVTAGILQQRGYPEVIERTIRGLLVAHEHKMAARRLNAVASGSTPVAMPDVTSGGAVAPLLSAIELQSEHVRYVHRLSRSATIEAVFPYWVRGAVRADLSNRLGVDLISVPDSRIDEWFRTRGIAPQFVYNWMDLSGEPDAANGWPDEVSFLMYPAGTWVGGGGEVISLDTVYDSQLLGTNDYTALFTEDSWEVIPMGHDSRLVTVPLCPNGNTHSGSAIECDSTTATDPVETTTTTSTTSTTTAA